MILSLDDGPLVPLRPVDGSRVGGWYADRGLTQFVSAENPYRHPMKSFRDTLYVDFVQEAVYIYTHVDLVEISCDGAYRIDQEKQACVVPIGRRRKDGRRLVEQLRRALSSKRTVAGAGVFLYRMGKLQCRTRISGRLTGPHAPAGPLAGCGDY